MRHPQDDREIRDRQDMAPADTSPAPGQGGETRARKVSHSNDIHPHAGGYAGARVRHILAPKGDSGMNDHSGPFDRILASLHEVALDYSRWPTASALIDEALGTHGSSMLLADGDTDEEIRVYFAWMLYRGEPHSELQRWYFENFYPIDERAPRVRKAPDSQLLHMSQVYTEKELKSSAAYNALRTHGRGGDGINVRLDGRNGSRITWLVHDPVDGNGWSSAQLDIIRGLLPHIRQTVRVQQTLANSGALGETVTELLDSTGVGILQLDARGRILAANDRARDLLRTGDTLLDEAGFLSARTPRDNDELQRRLGRALPPFGVRAGGGPREGGSLIVKRPGSRPPLLLHVNPVGQSENDLRAWSVAALVLIVDPARTTTTVDPTLVEAALGLSPMQSQVAVRMTEGISVPAIAENMDRKTSTIRTHVKAMYGKLGLTRQEELVRLVRSLARSVDSRR